MGLSRGDHRSFAFSWGLPLVKNLFHCFPPSTAQFLGRVYITCKPKNTVCPSWPPFAYWCKERSSSNRQSAENRKSPKNYKIIILIRAKSSLRFTYGRRDHPCAEAKVLVFLISQCVLSRNWNTVCTRWLPSEKEKDRRSLRSHGLMIFCPHLEL
jgi:hypothetical protein